MIYSEEQLNFFKLCHIVFDMVAKGLRKIFKQEWDALYTTAHGQWDDTPVSYNVFKSMETSTNGKDKILLNGMSSGNRNEWDCTYLFYAILRSDSIGPKIDAVVKSSVDDLRETRNALAHPKDDKLSDVEFRLSIQKIKVAFSSLKLDTTEIEEVKHQAGLPTENVHELKKKLQKIKREYEDEKRRNLEPNSFCLLPPRPSHDTIERSIETDKLYQEMQRLSSEKNGETTVVYLSGNPGSGKSVLARQIGEKWYNDTKQLSFVVTLNPSSFESLLHSYITFAKKLNCPLDSITKISKSKYLPEDKILQLKALVNGQVNKYFTWLIIVDEVIDQKFHDYLPQSGEMHSGKGQILFTTQDNDSILKSTHISHHVSLACGMARKEDAIQLLSKVSGDKDVSNNTTVMEVSEALEFQPLSLSCIAVYMRNKRTIHEQYTWEQCLEDLKKENETPKTGHRETNTAYKETMISAVNLALRTEMDNEIMLHAFRFLSVLASDSISLKYVVEYVIKSMENENRDLAASTISSSSLMFLSAEGTRKISIHEVVYQSLLTNQKVSERPVNMFTVVSALCELTTIKEDTMVDAERPSVNHLVKIAETITNNVITDSVSECDVDDNVLDVLQTLSSTLYNLFKFECAQHSLQVLLALQLSKNNIQEILGALKDDDNCHTYISNISCSNGKSANTVANTLNILGNTYQELGRLQTSIACYEKALTIYKAVHSVKPNVLGDTFYNLGNAYRELRLFQETVKYYEKALEMYKTAGNRLLVINILKKLGDACQELGRFEESVTHYEEAHDCHDIDTVAAHGEKQSIVRDILNNLGITCRVLGRYEESVRYHKKALAIFKDANGENHRLVGDTLNNLGNTYQALGRLQESITCYEKALDIQTRAYGENHQAIGDTLSNLGDAYKSLKRFDDARNSYRQALDIFKNTEDHHSVLRTENKLHILDSDSSIAHKLIFCIIL